MEGRNGTGTGSGRTAARVIAIYSKVKVLWLVSLQSRFHLLLLMSFSLWRLDLLLPPPPLLLSPCYYQTAGTQL